MRTLRSLRRFWPVIAMLVAIIAVQAVWASRYAASGHAADHLSSATAVFGITFLIGVIVWGVGADHRRGLVLWLLAALTVLGALGVAAGNVSVVDAIGTESWSYEEADALGPSRPGFTDGHDLAQRAAWGTVVATVLLAGWLGFRRVVSPWVAGAAVVASVVFPSWVLPGAGLLVLAGTLVVGLLRGGRSPIGAHRPSATRSR